MIMGSFLTISILRFKLNDVGLKSIWLPVCNLDMQAWASYFGPTQISLGVALKVVVINFSNAAKILAWGYCDLREKLMGLTLTQIS